MSPSKRIAIALRKGARLEDAGARAQLALLRELRRGVLSALGESAGFRTWHLSHLLAAIDREILRYRPVAEEDARNVTRTSFLLGTSMVDDVVAIAGQTGFGGFSSQLLQAALDVTTGQITTVWDELGARLRTQVRRAAFGVDDPVRAMQQLARVIRDPKTFGTSLTRAEAIIRTEVGRTFSAASQYRMTQSNSRLGGGLKKWWLTAEDARVRHDHAVAGEEYSKKADPDRGHPGPIPVDEPFIVGGEELMFPRDPQASARQTVNCRCQSVPYVDDIALPSAA